MWKVRPAESLNLAKLLFQKGPLTLLVPLRRQCSMPNLTMREGVQMRRVFALLLSVLMVMSLLVVAGAEDKNVTLSIEPQEVAQGATEVLFDIYLNPNGTEKKIGAFQFSVSGEGCTITGPTYINSSLEYSEGEGAFAYFGGNLNGGVYTFVAAGTAKDQYTVDGKTYPAHIWNAAEKTKIVTLKATIDSGASSCKLIVDMESDKRFSVGYDDGTGKGVQPCYTVAVDSKAASLSGSGALLGDVNGDGKVNAKDVVLVRRYCANATKYPLDASQLQAADVFQDGKVNAKDVVALRRFCANPAKYPLN